MRHAVLLAVVRANGDASGRGRVLPAGVVRPTASSNQPAPPSVEICTRRCHALAPVHRFAMMLIRPPSPPFGPRHLAGVLGALALLGAGLATPLRTQQPTAGTSGAGTPTGAPSLGAAPVRTVRALRAERLMGHLTLDGRLDEPAWAGAPVATDFTQGWPKPGAPATFRTEVRVLYDDAALYVGVRAFDPHPDSIAAPLARRDAVGIYSDWVHVVVDSYHDRRTAFRFSVNPRGVQKDVLHSNDRNEDIDWDAVWEVGTRVDSLGWTAEYRIPLSQLRFGPAPAGEARTWGLQVQRDVARLQERDTWAPWTGNSPGYVSLAGDLTNIVDLPVPRRLEILPYASERVTRAPGAAADPFYRATATRTNLGADFKAGLPNGLTLNGTLNPDFGQVEVDPAVVNLTAFETFFPEKRPFFVEGANVFDFGRLRVNSTYGYQQFFYSRRVGRPPQRSLSDDATTAYADEPDATTILGAAKLSGRTGPWTVGLLDAVTDPATGRFVTTDGVRGSAAVAPRSNFLVGRLRRDVGANTTVGGLLTSTERALGDSALAGSLRAAAAVGGVDFEHRWGGQAWSLGGYLAGSRVTGRPGVISAAQQSSARYFQRPDARGLGVDSTRTALQGTMAELALSRQGAASFSVDLKQASPGFEINDLGFQSRVDYRSATASGGYYHDRASGALRSWGSFGGVNTAWNTEGDHIWQSLFANVNASFQNLWSAGMFAGFDPSTLDDRATRGGPLMRRPWDYSVAAFGSTSPRRAVSGNAQINAARDAVGGWQVGFSPSVELRPGSSVRVTVGPTLTRTFDTRQYVTAAADSTATATYGARYVFGALLQTTLSADTRVEWTFSPHLSFQLYAQPFVSAGRYARFGALTAARAQSIAVFGRDLGTAVRDPATHAVTLDPDGAGPAPAIALGDPDFKVRALRGNAVVRWEYRPGSALFFVWQQARNDGLDDGRFGIGRDVGAIFRDVPTNVLLVKATFWAAR